MRFAASLLAPCERLSSRGLVPVWPEAHRFAVPRGRIHQGFEIRWT